MNENVPEFTSNIDPPPLPAERPEKSHGQLFRFETIPSWMVSLVFHLSTFVVFASMLLPVSDRRDVPVLFMGMLNASDSKLELPPQVQLEIDPIIDESNQEPIEFEDTSEETVPDPYLTDSPSKGEGDSQKNHAEATDQESARAKVILKPANNATAISQANVTPDDHSPNQTQPNWKDPELQDQYDQIVNRFIMYDLGRLRGREGQIAHRQFHALQTDAIPSLVRGLNKSAYYRGSCPVAVISSKLQTELLKTRDPSLVQYAADHLGDGIRENMPHASRVFAMKRSIQQFTGGDLNAFLSRRGRTSQQQQIARAMSVLESMELPSDPFLNEIMKLASLNESEFIKRVENATVVEDQKLLLAASELRFHSVHNVPKLGAALTNYLHTSDDKLRENTVRVLAMISRNQNFENNPNAWTLYWRCKQVGNESPIHHALAQPDHEFHLPALKIILSRPTFSVPGQQVISVANGLVDDLSNANPNVSELAHQALVRLSKGPDFGTDPTTWRAFWKQYKTVNFDEPASESRLRSALALMENGRTKAGRRYLRMLIEDFPNTKAAKRAAMLLE